MRLKLVVFVLLDLVTFALIAAAQGRVTVRVIDRQTDNGVKLTLQLPNGDTAVVSCTHKPAFGNNGERPCRVPPVDSFEVAFHGDKAKLIWPTSLDGTKMESETYKIIAVFKAKVVPVK